MEQLYVLFADDSAFMRIAYKRVLESHLRLRIVAMAGNGEEATKMAEEAVPDVAILDVGMPKVDRIQAAYDIRNQNPDTAVVVISSYEDLNLVADLMQNGVEWKAYLFKDSISDITDLVGIVDAVHEGHTVLDSGIVRGMACLYCKHSAILGTDLNEVDQDILGLMTEGYDDNHISEFLHLGRSQLVECLASLFEKLGIFNGKAEEQRLLAIRTFVGQIHNVPLFGAYVVS